MGKATMRAIRYHDLSVGHTVHQHESKCAHLHGHNYRVHFEVEAENGELDKVGRVMDFSVIKGLLCEWLETNWDHKFLVYAGDPRAEALKATDPQGVVVVHFNPTAENMAEHLVEVVGPFQLMDTGIRLARVVIEETRKCSCSYEKVKG